MSTYVKPRVVQLLPGALGMKWCLAPQRRLAHSAILQTKIDVLARHFATARNLSLRNVIPSFAPRWSRWEIDCVDGVWSLTIKVVILVLRSLPRLAQEVRYFEARLETISRIARFG